MKTKAVAVVLIILLVLNMVLFALNKIPGLVFWVAIGVIALIAFKGIPYLKKKQ